MHLAQALDRSLFDIGIDNSLPEEIHRLYPRLLRTTKEALFELEAEFGLRFSGEEVALVAVIFALFSAFPMFADVSMQLRHFVFANFIPATGDVIQNYIEQFVANSSKMTAVGACGLIVTALLL
ncbi:YihY family inner membrane protein, partial [Klebsiella aerogenes]|uniref:YihY family inner membrane protein n=1 Tax=Klebsiella aerogenes TaxID=548 RepID=UPI001D0D8438